MKNIYTPEEILKTAVKKSKFNVLTDKKYILCERIVATGFDWFMIQDEYGEKSTTACIIIGVDPFRELNLNTDFIFGDNKYIFYIKEKNTYYSDEMRMEILEYVVTDWDILYPIKRSFLDFFASKKYITAKDAKTDTPTNQ
jgi:hypothetical protein